MSKIDIKRAQFSTVPSSGDPLVVHFNPTSLQLVVSNQLEEDRQDHKQYVKKTTAKLTMDLIFDTTDKGEDVRNTTKKIENLMKPKENQRHKKVPPVALFEWGLFKFQGIVESYKETIDFFSHEGVPLRAGINLTLAEQGVVFEDNGQGGGDGSGSGSGSGPSRSNGSGSTPSADAVDVAPANNQNTTEMATAGGDPGAGRDIAPANEEENMRFPSGSMTLDPSVELGAPVAFASGAAGAGLGAGLSAGAGFGAGAKGGIGIGGGAGISARAGVGFSAGAAARAGIGIGGGAGVSGGARIGVGASFSAGAATSASIGSGFGARGNLGGAAFGASASAGANASFSAGAAAGPAFGGSASAGVTASEGAFAGLRVKIGTRRFTLDTSRFVQPNESAAVTTDSGARFRIGGQATLNASTSLSTDVGAGSGVSGRIQFEEG